jgi:Lipoprotein signal peptidase
MKNAITPTTRVILYLTTADQLVKLFIRLFFFESRFNILSDVLTFFPVVNTKYSWVAHYLPFLESRFFAVAINVVIGYFIYRIYKDYTKQHGNGDKTVDLIFVLAMAGTLCSFIDKLFGGSIDFLYLKGFFIFDIKDVYIVVAQGILLVKYLVPLARNKVKEQVAATSEAEEPPEGDTESDNKEN